MRRSRCPDRSGALERRSACPGRRSPCARCPLDASCLCAPREAAQPSRRMDLALPAAALATYAARSVVTFERG